MNDPDASLLARVGQGNEAAFRELVARKLGRVHALAARLLDDRSLADDVAQEALLRVWRTAAAWRPGAARFDTWLHRVVLNLCTDRLRRDRLVFVAEPPERPDPAPAAEDCLLREDAGRRVRIALGRLPERQREAIVLQHYQELPNTEAAVAMGISVEALESLLARARRTLRLLLQKDEP